MAATLPTLAVHANPEMKLVPVTVMVLLAYAEVGAMEAAAGGLTTDTIPTGTVTKIEFEILSFTSLSTPGRALVGIVDGITKTAIPLQKEHEELK